MRIKEVAEAAGTTPRAIRHYHHLGLLPVPPTVRGRREYGVEHLARLMRIRWLADGGLGLGRIAELIEADASGDDRERVLADLRATRAGILAEQRGLRQKAARVERLIAQLETGGPLSPMPTTLERFYDAVQERVTAAGGQSAALVAERQLVQVMGAAGLIPASAEAFVAALDEADLDLAAQQVADFSALGSLPDAERASAATELAERTWSLLCRHRDEVLGVAADLPTGRTGRALWALLSRLAQQSYSDPAQRVFTSHLVRLIHSDPQIAALIRRSTGEEMISL